MVARNAAALSTLAEELGGTAHAADLADPGLVTGLVGRIEADGGPVDVLVNNAGLGTGRNVVDFTAAELEAIFRVNLLAPAELCRQVLPGMLERGVGHIVNVSSLAGVAPFPGLAVYASTKAGLTQFTAGLRADLRGSPVRTTVVELGPVPTDLLDAAEEHRPTADSFRRFAALQLLPDIRRDLVAEEVVAAVENDRRHVRLPKRAAVFSLMTEAPRRLAEVLLSGVPHQAPPPR